VIQAEQRPNRYNDNYFFTGNPVFSKKKTFAECPLTRENF